MAICLRRDRILTAALGNQTARSNLSSFFSPEWKCTSCASTLYRFRVAKWQLSHGIFFFYTFNSFLHSVTSKLKWIDEYLSYFCVQIMGTSANQQTTWRTTSGYLCLIMSVKTDDCKQKIFFNLKIPSVTNSLQLPLFDWRSCHNSPLIMRPGPSAGRISSWLNG